MWVILLKDGTILGATWETLRGAVEQFEALCDSAHVDAIIKNVDTGMIVRILGNGKKTDQLTMGKLG